MLRLNNWPEEYAMPGEAGHAVKQVLAYSDIYWFRRNCINISAGFTLAPAIASDNNIRREGGCTDGLPR